MFNFKVHFTLLFASFLLAACSQEKTAVSTAPQTTQEIFSDRETGLSTEILMVQLLKPALLETSMNSQDLQDLQSEQAEFEYKLSRLSGEIRILYRYKFTLNGFALVTPSRLIPEIQKLLDVKTVEMASPFERPVVELKGIKSGPNQDSTTSVNFLGAQFLHEKGFKGQGISVGIIDTGIDYTHSMLGGSGNVEDYKGINPSITTPLFPNDKVVGGIDLVGSQFSARSNVYEDKIPQPDPNPLDESGHGTHVAGTVAGRGDQKNTYDGVAPEAKLHAIKVFGNGGGTFDAIVIAGFEYAVDPNGDMNIDDRLDVVNLSLGGNFGTKKILYSKAIENLGKSGMIVVAAAGNSGAVNGVVGSPSTAEEAISVAASVDAREINWRFATVRIDFPNQDPVSAEYTEGTMTKPVSEIASLSGKLVNIGLADEDLSDEKKKSLSGNVALIQRGGVPFLDKLRRAQEGGAIGAVVYNNENGPPIPMGSDSEIKLDIPGVMISKALGESISASLDSEDVYVDFKSQETVEKPELIDSITDFSSRGPRTDDYGFKPEVSAPGEKILSAKFGSGSDGALNNGTSMAAPHVSGAMALLRQLHPTLSPQELKSLLMGTAKNLVQPKKNESYKFSTQGAGRIQLKEASLAVYIASPSLSLGVVEVPQRQALKTTFFVKNLTDSPLTLNLSFSGKGFQIDLPSAITLNGFEQRDVPVEVILGNGATSSSLEELNGEIRILSENHSLKVPVMAFKKTTSSIKTSDLNLSENKLGKSDDHQASLTLTNQGDHAGTALLFNLIGTDERKAPATGQHWRSQDCDLQSVGYRWISKPTTNGPQPHLQFAFQVYERRSQLKHCDFSILIDFDKDGKPDQEIIGIGSQSVYGFQSREFNAAVLDYNAAQEIRRSFEIASLLGQVVVPNYGKAAVGLGELHFAQDSGLTVIDIPIAALKVDGNNEFQAKIAAINNLGESWESDDYLGDDENSWRTLTTNRFHMGFWGMTDLSLKPKEEKTLSFMKSQGENPLVLYSPTNEKTSEAQIIRPKP